MYKSYREQEKTKAVERAAHMDAMAEAMQSVLRNNLRKICMKAETRGYIRLYEVEAINNMLPPYEKLGGNGTTKQLCHSALKLPHYREDVTEKGVNSND